MNRVDPTGEGWYWYWFKRTYWDSWGSSPKPKKKCCDKDASKKAAEDLSKSLAGAAAGQFANLPGKAGAVGKLVQVALQLEDTRATCDEMDQLVETCSKFAEKPSYVGCVTCCIGLFTAVPLAGVMADIKCINTCEPFQNKD